jgi:hypothetical protein
LENTTPKTMTLVCKTCQKEFVWSANEQRYYAKKGFSKQPQHCASCRKMANKLRESATFYIHCGICDNDGAMLNPPPKDRVAICENCFIKLADEINSKASNPSS